MIPTASAFLSDVAAASVPGKPSSELGRVLASLHSVAAATRGAAKPAAAAAAADGAGDAPTSEGGVVAIRAFWAGVAGKGGLDALLGLLDASGVRDVEMGVLHTLTAAVELSATERELRTALHAWAPLPQHALHALGVLADGADELGACPPARVRPRCALHHGFVGAVRGGGRGGGPSVGRRRERSSPTR
jgi:hypothetical protein